jgi:hypothetical protein
MDQFTGEERFASYMIHYAGYPSLEFVLNIIRSDKQKWERDKPDYKYRRHILVDVQGGLGDQISAQPAVRYMREHVYPEDDIVIKTHFPEIFRGIDADIYEHGEFRRASDTPYYHVNSLPGPNTIMWMCASNLLCHIVDFCSMALLRRTLPFKDKSFKLIYTKEEEKEMLDTIGNVDFTDLVVIHAGRHWQSKTFPTDWWQGVIDGIAKNHKVCLIGYNEKTRGTVPVVAGENVIDLRDQLTLGALMALLDKAHVLISNDSAPIHIAGAYDNWIILIPTCKHPDHVLPFRNGKQNYKTKAPYKRLTIDDADSRPTTVHGSLGDKIQRDYKEYLPEIEEVVNSTEECFSKIEVSV